MSTTPATTRSFAYVSNAGDGTISAYRLDVAAGTLAPIGTVAAGTMVMPMTVSPDRRRLYAVVRSEPFRVLSYAIDAVSGRLAEVAAAPLPDSMASVSTDATGRWLFTCSYGGDKVAVSPIAADGAVQKGASDVLVTGRHAHAVRADRSNRFVYVPLLGATQVLQFGFDAISGRLSPLTPPAIAARAGMGPRHLVVAPDNRFLYVLGELSGAVMQSAIDPATGTLSEIDSVDSVPADAGLAPGVAQAPVTAATAGQAQAASIARIWAADLQMTPDGRFLYASERTRSEIALMRVDRDTGRLGYVTRYATEAQPRGIGIDASGRVLIATGEKSDQLSVYRIDAESGELALASRAPAGTGANWVEIVSFR